MQKENVFRLMRDPDLNPSEKQKLILDIAAVAQSLGFPCYIVGGFVRDILLRLPVKDIDIVVEGNAVELGKSLVKKFGGKLTKHEKFQTAIWQTQESANGMTFMFDLITARSETYNSPGALPTVTSSTIVDDLHRRDFTFNAMAIRLDGVHFGELLDPLNGQIDLDKKIIRVLYPRSFVDDPTRVFRAIRYEGRYSFKMDLVTERLINSESLMVLSELSGERIRHELDLIFAEKKSPSMLEKMGELGLFKYIHPILPLFDKDYYKFLDPILNPDFDVNREILGYVYWLMKLETNDIVDISKRLEFTADLTRIVVDASELLKILPKLADSRPGECTFMLDKFHITSVYALYLLAGDDSPLKYYLTHWRFVKSKTTGDDLLKMGLSAGPRFGEILTRLRKARLDGEIENDVQEQEMLKSLLK